MRGLRRVVAWLPPHGSNHALDKPVALPQLLELLRRQPQPRALRQNGKPLGRYRFGHVLSPVTLIVAAEGITAAFCSPMTQSAAPSVGNQKVFRKMTVAESAPNLKQSFPLRLQRAGAWRHLCSAPAHLAVPELKCPFPLTQQAAAVLHRPQDELIRPLSRQPSGDTGRAPAFLLFRPPQAGGKNIRSKLGHLQRQPKT